MSSITLQSMNSLSFPWIRQSTNFARPILQFRNRN